MIADIDINSVGTAAASVAAIVTAIAVVFRLFGNYILHPYAKAQALKDDDRLDSKLAPLTEELVTIRQEVTWNHGTSLKDAVRNLDRRVTRFEGRFDEHDKYVRKEGEGT
jgi:hypothetical protein